MVINGSLFWDIWYFKALNEGEHIQDKIIIGTIVHIISKGKFLFIRDTTLLPIFLTHRMIIIVITKNNIGNNNTFVKLISWFICFITGVADRCKPVCQFNGFPI